MNQEAQEWTQTNLRKGRGSPVFYKTLKLFQTVPTCKGYVDRGYRHVRGALRIAPVCSRTSALISTHRDEMAARDSDLLEKPTGAGQRVGSGVLQPQVYCVLFHLIACTEREKSALITPRDLTSSQSKCREEVSAYCQWDYYIIFFPYTLLWP